MFREEGARQILLKCLERREHVKFYCSLKEQTSHSLQRRKAMNTQSRIILTSTIMFYILELQVCTVYYVLVVQSCSTFQNFRSVLYSVQCSVYQLYNHVLHPRTSGLYCTVYSVLCTSCTIMFYILELQVCTVKCTVYCVLVVQSCSASQNFRSAMYSVQ